MADVASRWSSTCTSPRQPRGPAGAHEWEAKEILWAMDRIPRSLWAYEDVGRVHLSLSGTLLETLSSPGFQDRVYGIADCGSLLWYLQNTGSSRFWAPATTTRCFPSSRGTTVRAMGAGRGSAPAPVRAEPASPASGRRRWASDGAHPAAQAPRLPLRARRQRTRRAGHPDGVGRAPLPPARRPVRRRRDHRRRPGPGALQRPGVGDGCRLVHQRGVPSGPSTATSRRW